MIAKLEHQEKKAAVSTLPFSLAAVEKLKLSY